MCVNNDFNNIRNNGYHSIRVIQDFIRKNKRNVMKINITVER